MELYFLVLLVKPLMLNNADTYYKLLIIQSIYNVRLGLGHFGRGHLGRGHYGRGHLGRGHYGRGHFGRGHLGRGHFGPLI